MRRQRSSRLLQFGGTGLPSMPGHLTSPAPRQTPAPFVEPSATRTSASARACARRGAGGVRSAGTGLLDAAEQDAAVVAAEAHRVRERDVDLGLARLVRDVVEVALRIGDLVVDRRREHAVADRERAT